MIRFFNFLLKFLIIFSLLFSFAYKANAEEEDNSILRQLQILQEDIKTLEKAVYSQDVKTTINSGEVTGNNNDVLTKHLLKLSELEEQFKNLTNNFEEINFKLDKLSNRITKIQTDNQMRFQDLEKGGLANIEGDSTSEKKKKLPGSDEAQDLGGVSDSDIAAAEQIQKTQSVESAGTVVTETAERAEKILPDGTAKEQYEFAVSFIKIGDYETAELALREFVDNNPNMN